MNVTFWSGDVETTPKQDITATYRLVEDATTPKQSVSVTLGQKKKDSCVQVSEVKKIRVGRSKNIFILDFLFITNIQRL